MMFMRRSPIGLFLMVGAGILIGAALFGTTAEVGSVVAVPFLVLGFFVKLALFVFLFGFLARAFGGATHRSRKGRGWNGPSSWSDEVRKRSDWWSGEARKHWDRRHEAAEPEDSTTDDRFEEWHRMAHARQEVDDHVPPVGD